MKKRITSLLLTASMFFGNAVLIGAETQTTIKYSKEFDIMTSLGFMDKAGSTDINSVLKRGEFTAMVCDLGGVLNMMTDTESPFSDVSTATKYYEEICIAAECGIVKGKSNSAFHPDDSITIAEAATMLINLLGYQSYAEISGGYPNGYLQIANSLGLFDGVDLSGKMTLGAGAVMMKNAGETQELERVSGADSMYEKTDKLFIKRHNIYSGEGIVEANEFTSIDSKEGAGNNMVKIGDVFASMYYSNLPTEYLGYNVEFYYRNDDDDNTMLYMTPEDTEVEIIKAENITDYIQNNIYYYEDGKNEKVIIPEEADIIYNGRMTTSYYVEENEAEKSIFDFDNGEIKLIDNNNDGDIDVVNILSYQNIVVSAVNVQAEKIYDMYDEEKSIDYSNADGSGYSWIVTDAEGNIINFSDIKEKNVLSVAKSADDEILRGVVSTETVVGTLISEEDGNSGNKIVTIGSNQYRVHGSYLKENSLPQIGNAVCALLDFEGGIAGFEVASSSAGYGYFIKKMEDEDADTYRVKLLNSDGVVENYGLADSIIIDGVRFKGSELNSKMENMSDYQTVLYRTNEEKQIIMLDTEVNDGGGESDVLRALSEDWVTSAYYSSVKNFNGSMVVGTKTKVLSIPNNEYRDDMSQYSVSSIPATEGGENFTFKGYVSTKDGFVPECLVMQAKGGGSMLVTSPYMLVEKVSLGLNADDEVTVIFEGYTKDGAKEKISVSQSCKAQENYTVNPDEIVPGDIIKYVTDNKGEITKISPLKTMGKEGFGIFKTGFSTWFSHAGYADFFGYLMAREENYMAIVNTKEQLKGEVKPDVCLTVDANARVYYISNEGNKVEIEKLPNGDTSVLTDYVHSYQETPVLITTGGGRVQNIYVYEEQ